VHVLSSPPLDISFRHDLFWPPAFAMAESSIQIVFD
jgi:hypothetical protein